MPLLLAFLVVLLSAPTEAAPRLPVVKVVIVTHTGPHVFHMEVAADEASRGIGLMHRTHLATNAGMLFDFHTSVMTAFWMKDTPLPLDMIFVRADGTISTVAANAVPYSLAEIQSAEPIRAVLEINGGLAGKLGIGPGDRVRAAIFPSR
jgi:uncharacterized membrane protein (UPF0127 family)